jgi:ribosomal-protein-alanine N-acetyltransferase
MDLKKISSPQELKSFILEQVLELETNCFYPFSWNRDQILSHIESNPLYVLLESERVLSYLLILVNPEEIEILRIGTDSKNQKKGYASLILDELFQEFPRHTYILEVRSSNSKAISLYEKKGFQKIHIRKKYYENLEDALLFKKEAL